MPDGGYPLHVMTIIEGTDLALMISGTKIAIVRLDEPTGQSRARYRITKLGTFTEDQVQALVYHLAYWGGLREGPSATPTTTEHKRTNHGHLRRPHAWTFNGHPVTPRFRTKGCIYDY